MRSAAFLMVAVTRPTMIGAVLPSSRYLARAMSSAADGASCLIELGAGTGAITRALRSHHPGTRLVAVEREPALADLLKQRFPEVEVCTSAAHTVLDGWSTEQAGVVAVSSLPFRSLPPEWRETTTVSIESFLLSAPGRRLVQFTYQPRVPFELGRPDQLRWRRVAWVWRNLPPAWVWTLSAIDGR